MTPGSARSRDVAEDVQRLAADRRQEDLDVAARDELRVHAAGFLEQRAAQVGLADLEARRHAGQPPHRLQRHLGDGGRGVVEQHAAVDGQALEGDRLLDLGQVDVRLGDGDRGPDVVALGQVVGIHLLHAGAPGVDGDDLRRVAPLRMRADRVGGRGVGEVGAVAARQVAGGHRERAVDAVAAAVRADDVALAAVRGGADDRAALQRVGRAPVDRRRARGPWPGCEVSRMWRLAASGGFIRRRFSRSRRRRG